MSDEAILANVDKLADETMRLYARPRTNGHSLLNFNERPYKHVIAERAAVDVAWLDDDNALACDNVPDCYLPLLYGHDQSCPRRLTWVDDPTRTWRPVSTDS